jgi:hypothetical protein
MRREREIRLEQEQRRRESQEELRKSRKEVDRLRKELSEKNNNSELIAIMQQQQRADEQARQNRIELQRLAFERQERREFEQKRLDAEASRVEQLRHIEEERQRKHKCQENICSTRIPSNQIYCPSHKKQTFHDWQKENKITEEEISKLSEFNLNGEYTLKQLREILEEDTEVNNSPIISDITTEYADFQTIIRDNLSKSLKRVRPRLALIVAKEREPIEPPIEIIPFST